MKITDAISKAKEENLNQDYAQLYKAIDAAFQVQDEYKSYEKIIKDSKNIIKEIALKHKLEKVTSTAGNTVTITEIDKSYLDVTATIDYLKKNNLSKYVKTKEYFDEAELIMDMSNGILNAADFAPLMVDKKEYRINFKK